MLLKRIVTLFFTVLILFADSGQMIYSHTCFKSKKTSYSITSPKSCCGKKTAEHKSCTIKNSCCSISAKYIKQSFVNDTKTVREVKQTAKGIAVTGIFEAFNPVTVISSVFSSSPPLLRCKDDIRFTQVFRI